MKITIEKPEYRDTTIGELKTGDVCIAKSPETKRDEIMMITDFAPDYGTRYLVELRTGRTHSLEDGYPATPLENAELRPYGICHNDHND